MWTHTVVRRNSDLKVSSTVIQRLHVHSFRIKHSSSRATNWPSYTRYDVRYWMWSSRRRGLCLEVARVLRTRDGDRRVNVCWEQLQRHICNRGSETPLLWFSCRHFLLLERRFSLDTFLSCATTAVWEHSLGSTCFFLVAQRTLFVPSRVV